MKFYKKVCYIVLVLVITSAFNILKVNANGKYLTDLILGENNSNVITSTPNFKPESRDKGLYVQKGDKNITIDGRPTYYYRGPVENNYVKFGTYKSDVVVKEYNGSAYEDKVVIHAGDPILFRIMRINEDGSIRLITDDIIAEAKYHDNSSIYKGSNYEKVANEWFNNTIENEKTLSNKVITGNFCNDISDNYNGARKRIADKNRPIFTCPSETINAKIATLSADEAMFAGINYVLTDYNNISYLNNVTDFFTMTPNYPTNIYLVNSDNSVFAGTNMSSEFGFKPVINLKNNVLATGSGTKDDPYVISKQLGNREIDLTNSTEVSKDDFLDASGNYDLIYNILDDKNNIKYSWYFNKDDIKNGVNFNLSVRLDQSELKEEIDRASNNVRATYISLENKDNFPGKATLSLNLNDRYSNGKKLWLYYYNEQTKKLEYVDRDIVLKDNIIKFDVEKGNEYILTEGEIINTVENPQTGINLVFTIVGLATVLIVSAYVFINTTEKRRKSK